MNKVQVKLLVGVALLGGLMAMSVPRMVEIYQEKKLKDSITSCPAVFVPVRDLVGVVTERIVSRNVDKNEARKLAVAAIGAANKYDLDVGLVVSVMEVESSFKWKAVSKKNAHGLMQVKPKWWKNATPHDMTTKTGNVYAGAYILAYYRDRLGSIDEAVKAYNVGITDYMKGANTEAADRYYDRVASVNKKFNEMD